MTKGLGTCWSLFCIVVFCSYDGNKSSGRLESVCSASVMGIRDIQKDFDVVTFKTRVGNIPLWELNYDGRRDDTDESRCEEEYKILHVREFGGAGGILGFYLSLKVLRG